VPVIQSHNQPDAAVAYQVAHLYLGP
jgi:hypothetical protein